MNISQNGPSMIAQHFEQQSVEQTTVNYTYRGGCVRDFRQFGERTFERFHCEWSCLNFAPPKIIVFGWRKCKMF